VEQGVPRGAGKRQLNGDTIREAGSDEVKELRTENDSLKMLVAELTLLDLRQGNLLENMGWRPSWKP